MLLCVLSLHTKGHGRSKQQNVRFLSGLKVNILKKPSTDQSVFQFIEVPGMSSNRWETCFFETTADSGKWQRSVTF